MIAKTNQIRIAPKKVNLIASLVRRKKAVDAVNILKFTNKKAAPAMRKTIESAIANAKNNFNQNEDNLVIKEILVTEGMTYKRTVPISRGRMNPILKRSSHITVKLATLDNTEPETKESKKTKKITKKTATAEKTENTEKTAELSETKKTTAKKRGTKTTVTTKSKKKITK